MKHLLTLVTEIHAVDDTSKYGVSLFISYTDPAGKTYRQHLGTLAYSRHSFAEDHRANLHWSTERFLNHIITRFRTWCYTNSTEGLDVITQALELRSRILGYYAEVDYINCTDSEAAAMLVKPSKEFRSLPCLSATENLRSKFLNHM